MSPASDQVEHLAHQHGVPVLHVLEFFLERAAIREYEGNQSRDEAEANALKDVEIWIALYRQINRKSTR